MECLGEHNYRQNQHQNMVAFLLSELLEVSATLCETTARALGSTNFTRVLGWSISNWSPTFSLGVRTLLLLQVQKLRAMDSQCYESQPVGSTLRIFHGILLHIQRLDSILCSMHTE